MRAVWVMENSLPPLVQEIAVPIEDEHGRLATGEDVDAIQPVDLHRDHVIEVPSLRQFRPIVNQPVAAIAMGKRGILGAEIGLRQTRNIGLDHVQMVLDR